MKAAELKELTVDELNKKVDDLRHELMQLRIAKAKQQLKNPLKVRYLRRDIARVLTLLRQKGAK